MRSLQRNKQTMYYRLCLGPEVALTDSDGYETGEFGIPYGDPVEFRANVCQATGLIENAQFGLREDYDKVITTTDMTCPIANDTVLYIDTVPVKSDGVWSKHDYVVGRISRSINSITIDVKKVDVS